MEKYSYDKNNKKMFYADEIISQVKQGNVVVDGLWIKPKVADRIFIEDTSKGSQLHETISNSLNKLNTIISDNGTPMDGMSLSDLDGKDVFLYLGVNKEYREYQAEAYG